METYSAIPPQLEAELRRELSTGERVIWSAQPIASRLKAAFIIWLFAVPWTAFALFWISMALMPWASSAHAPNGIKWTFGIVMPLFGLPFVAIGFWMLWQPIKVIRKTKNTIYGLTDQRLIRLIIGEKREATSVLLHQIGPLKRNEASDGIGHLRIQTHSRIDSDGDRITESFEVLGVPGIAQLERLILERTTTP